MSHRIVVFVTAAALIAGTGWASAQSLYGNAYDGAASGPGSASTPHPVTGDGPIRGGFGVAPIIYDPRPAAPIWVPFEPTSRPGQTTR
jgi:hypothetical protein